MSRAVLKFNGYKVEKIEYKRTRIKLGKFNTTDVNPNVLFKLILEEDNIYNANIILGIQIRHELLPFEIEVIVRGFFSLDQEESMDREGIYKFYIKNGSAIMYPYVRAIVSSVTSNGNEENIIMPTVNFYSLVEELDIEELIMDSSNYDDGN